MNKKNSKTKTPPITTLFLDIGGVLLTNGWDRKSRNLAAQHFHLDCDDMQERHHLTFDTYESGKIDLEEYLQRVVFYQKRSFTRAQFKAFMFTQSQPYPQMLELICQLKSRYGLKIAVVSNEARELNIYRIKKFKLHSFVDFFISSCYVHLRKPDADIFRMALDISQTPTEQVLYIEDRLMFVSVAEGLGIKGIHHTDYQSTCEKLAKFGLEGISE
ncbi:MAG TPA: HAD family phosphatase [Gammaproteobacteria bacterium]|nr:HAD family phosphatase [Gammaproteobacteria bacterium]